MTSQYSRQLLLLGFNAAMGGFLFGYDTASMGAALLQVKRPSGEVPCPGLAPTALEVYEQEMVTAFVILGAFLSAMVAGRLTEVFGRRKVLLGGALIFIVGTLLMAFSMSLAQMLAARIVVGIAVGVSSHTVPLYISECSPASSRGAMCFMNAVMIVVGQAAAAVISTAFFFGEVPNGWRYILGLAAAPAIMMFIGFFFQPESPRWLLSQGQKEEALQTLRILRGAGDVEAEAAVEKEFQEMAKDVGTPLIGASSSSHGREQPGIQDAWRTVWRDTHIRRALALGCGLQALQQWTGVNTIMYYGASVLQRAGPAMDVRGGNCFTAENKRDVATTIAFAAAQLVGVLFGLVLVDRIGRRPLILTSLAGVVASLIAVGAAFHAAIVSQQVVVTFVALYLVSFGIGMSPVPWTVNAEIYPPRARADCISLATSVNWLMNFVVAQSFLTLSSKLSTNKADPQNHPDGVFWLYAGIGTVGLWLLMFKMPETKDVELEEMSAVFVGPEENKVL